MIHFKKEIFRNLPGVVVALFSLTFANSGFAQTTELAYSHRWTVVSGLTQPIFLSGWNLAVNYTTNRWVYEYSHGVGLTYSGPALKSPYKDDVVSIESPYSTGTGAGYRFFAHDIVGLDLRAEAKIHRYDVQLNDTEKIDYINFDLGGGLYTQIRPFGKKDNGWKGIVIEPSVRYWANVASSLDDNYTYVTNDGRTVTHEPYPLNLFFNVSIGYTFVK